MPQVLRQQEKTIHLLNISEMNLIASMHHVALQIHSLF